MDEKAEKQAGYQRKYNAQCSHLKILRTIPNPSFTTAAAISAIIHASAIPPPT